MAQNFEGPYGLALTVPFELYGSADGQPKTDTALSSGDAKVFYDGVAKAANSGNADTLPTVSGGRWTWALSAAEMKGGKLVECRIAHAGYFTETLVVRTTGDARSGRPETAQIHSSAISASPAPSTTSVTLSSTLAAVPDSALLVRFVTSTGAEIAQRGATTSNGAAYTLAPALSAGAVTAIAAAGAVAHVYAAPLEPALSSDAFLAEIANDAEAARAAAVAAQADLANGVLVDSLDADSLASIADAILARRISGAASGSRTVREALAQLRNRVSPNSDGTQLIVYAEDDVTPLYALTIQRLPVGTAPITGVTPAGSVVP